MKRFDLTGKTFGYLTVTSYSHSEKTPYGSSCAIWNCHCKCGKTIQVKSDLLRNGKTKSCGCLRHEVKPREDLSGKKFGRLTVIKLHGRNASQKITWDCKCECGKMTVVIGAELKKGTTKSCGCYKTDKAKSRAKHGLSNSRLRSKWRFMIQRCENPKSVSYKNYGGRGIKVCDEWHDLNTFAKWAFENGYQEVNNKHEYTIDRIDVNGNYEPSNCRFVNMKKQCRNKRYNHLITYNSETKTLAEWSELTGINRSTIAYREKHDLPLFEERNAI